MSKETYIFEIQYINHSDGDKSDKHHIRQVCSGWSEATEMATELTAKMSYGEDDATEFHLCGIEKAYTEI